MSESQIVQQPLSAALYWHMCLFASSLHWYSIFPASSTKYDSYSLAHAQAGVHMLSLLLISPFDISIKSFAQPLIFSHQEEHRKAAICLVGFNETRSSGSALDTPVL